MPSRAAASRRRSLRSLSQRLNAGGSLDPVAGNPETPGWIDGTAPPRGCPDCQHLAGGIATTADGALVVSTSAGIVKIR